MAMQSMAELSGRPKGSTTDDKVQITRQINRGATKLAFYIGSNIRVQCGMEAGHKLDVLWDDKTKKGAIIIADGGKSLTVLRNGRGVLVFTWREGMPIPEKAEGPIEVDNLQIESKDQEIHFTFPEGCL